MVEVSKIECYVYFSELTRSFFYSNASITSLERAQICNYYLKCFSKFVSPLNGTETWGGEVLNLHICFTHWCSTYFFFLFHDRVSRQNNSQLLILILNCIFNFLSKSKLCNLDSKTFFCENTCANLIQGCIVFFHLDTRYLLKFSKCVSSFHLFRLYKNEDLLGTWWTPPSLVINPGVGVFMVIFKPSNSP